MIPKFEIILKYLLIYFTENQLLETFNVPEEDSCPEKCLTYSFLILLAGESHPDYDLAKTLFLNYQEMDEYTPLMTFYRNAIPFIHREIERLAESNNQWREILNGTFEYIKREAGFDKNDIINKTWSLFFPEAQNILNDQDREIQKLKEKRKINIRQLNESPILNPGNDILFTSNVLLTLPPESRQLSDLDLPLLMVKKLESVKNENQHYWYDHPVQIGVQPQNNEILYGLKELNEAVQFEKDLDNFPKEETVTVVLSVSVTHDGLHEIAGDYIRFELVKAGHLNNLKIFAFTENDIRDLVKEVLNQAGIQFLNRNEKDILHEIIGVDGHYGRHYSFLKAISVLWQICMDPEIKATFKIDLDQVFPQENLVSETGQSAFDHFKTSLWGACGEDNLGRPIELGMIAGALVNQSEIDQSIFTPDVTFPGPQFTADEYIFCSRLPQALATEAEMMTRYNDGDPDGIKSCIQRIHVTGGTNGILISALRKHRPFTPSFIGRAEDQAYSLSTFTNPGTNLGYVHKDGLFMRHDKEAFAGEAIQSAYIGKLIGDYVRILMFSAYARILSDDIRPVKERIDPFTGSFVSRLPVTVVLLRFALKAASLFNDGKKDDAVQFIHNGVSRISRALEETDLSKGTLRKRFEREQKGWDLYYDIIEAWHRASADSQPEANQLREKARQIIKKSRVM